MDLSTLRRSQASSAESTATISVWVLIRTSGPSDAHLWPHQTARSKDDVRQSAEDSATFLSLHRYSSKARECTGCVFLVSVCLQRNLLSTLLFLIIPLRRGPPSHSLYPLPSLRQSAHQNKQPARREKRSMLCKSTHTSSKQ